MNLAEMTKDLDASRSEASTLRTKVAGSEGELVALRQVRFKRFAVKMSLRDLSLRHWRLRDLTSFSLAANVGDYSHMSLVTCTVERVWLGEQLTEANPKPQNLNPKPCMRR